jgi:hypothetical protein
MNWNRMGDGLYGLTTAPWGQKHSVTDLISKPEATYCVQLDLLQMHSIVVKSFDVHADNPILLSSASNGWNWNDVGSRGDVDSCKVGIVNAQTNSGWRRRVTTQMKRERG